MDERFDRIEDLLTQLIGNLASHRAETDSKFGRLEQRFDQKFTDLDKKVEKLDGDLRDFKATCTQRFNTLDANFALMDQRLD